MNYIKINTFNLESNINYLKQEYNYKYYIMDVSNNAYNHGMYIIHYLKNIHYLYVNNLKDIYLIRKYNKDIPIILETSINPDNIWDLINNNIILVVSSLDELKSIMNFDLFANFKIMLKIDMQGLRGFSNKFQIRDALTIIEATKKLELMGIMAFDIVEKDYDEFLDTINELLMLNLELYLFNNENDKKRIKTSNAILLDNSIYGINPKKKLFQKEVKHLKQVFSLYSTINNIKKENKGKKELFYGLIPLGSINGISKINKVYINNKPYNISETFKDYSLIQIDEDIKINDDVLITSDINPLEDYIDDNVISYLSVLSYNFTIIYNDYVLEKVYSY